jgi:membrane protein
VNRLVSGAQDAVRGRWRALKARSALVRHVADAWQRLRDSNGNQYAAAITYFSFLALFPLVLLAVSIAGFVLHSQPELQQRMFDQLAQSVPGALGNTLRTSINTAIDARAGVGLVGLAGVLLTGLGWVGNVRQSIDAVWHCEAPDRNFLLAKLMNLLVLAGLGVGVLVSLALTAGGTAATDQILGWLNLQHTAGARLTLKGAGLLVAVAGDMLIFWWLLVRLPLVSMPRVIAFKGVLMAAIGFEALKIIGTYTIANTANKATAGPFASLLAILIWFQLVARFLLLCSAWMATVTAAATARPVDEDLGEPLAPPAEPSVSPAAVGATLVGAGAVMGAAAAGWVATRRGARQPPRP